MNVVMRSALCTYGNLTLTNEKQVTQLPVGPGVTKCDKFLCGDVNQVARNNADRRRLYAT